MEIRFDKSAVKFLKGLPQKLRASILEAIRGLTQKPPKGDIKPLQGYKDGRQRLRVGNVLFTGIRKKGKWKYLLLWR